MTVGIVAKCETNTPTPKVVFAADRMLTERRRSPIEYEHPGTKLTELSKWADQHQVFLVYSGTVSYAQDFSESLNSVINQVRQETPDLTIHQMTTLAERQYNEMVRENVRQVALEPFDLGLDDLQKQHKFKDGFFEKLWQDAEQAKQQIKENLNVLIGGVDQTGAQMFGIDGGGASNLNGMGYAATGSGVEPARSEFIRTRYSDTASLADALSTTISAKMRAESAQGVGELTDMAIATPTQTYQLTDDQIKFLHNREEDIQEKQEEAKNDILERQTLDLELD